MAAGVTTVLADSHNTADAASYDTASIAPTAGALLTLVVLSGRTDATAAAVNSAVGCDGSAADAWAAVVASPIANGYLHLSVWQCIADGSSGVVTFGFPGTQLNVHWRVLQTVGGARSTNYGVFQGVSTSTLNLPTAPASDSEILGAIGVQSSTQIPTVGAGFTQLGSSTVDTTPTDNMMAERRTGTTAQVVNFTPAGTSQNVLIGLEIPSAAGGPLPVADKDITFTRVVADGGTTTQSTEVDYTASTDTTSIAVDAVTGGGLVTGDIGVAGLVLTFTDDPDRAESVVIDVTLTGPNGTTADSVTVPPLGAPSGITERVWTAGSPDAWA